MKGNQDCVALSLLVVLWSISWSVCLADGGDDPCRYFSNNTEIRDPNDCSVGITCIDFKSADITKCSGSTPFYDKDKNVCAKSLSKSTCEISCVNSTGKFVTDPKSCYGFYYCQEEDVPLYGRCPEKTHFDFATQSCVYTSQSGCTIKDINFCEIVKDNVNFNDPSNCKKYFKCSKGVLKSVECQNEYYNPVLGICQRKSLVPCDAHPYPAGVCGTASKPKSNVFVSDDATCRGAFYCAAVKNGFDMNPTWIQCPENKFFSEKDQACVNPLSVACSADRCDGRNLTFVSSGTKGCRHYLRCANGVMVEELTCGNNFFDEVASVCTPEIITYTSCQ